MEKTARNFIDSLKVNPEVLGILLFGSRARGNDRPDSDYDLLVIVQQGFKKAIERREETTFEIIYTTEQGCSDYWQGSKDDCVDLWQVAKILFDRDGTVQRLKAVADRIKEAGKDSLTVEELSIAHFEIFDQFKAIKNLVGLDDTTAKMLLTSLTLRLTGLYFDLRRFWTPPPKQRLEVIKNHDPEFYGLIVEVFSGNSLEQQITLVEEMAQKVFEKAN